MRGAAVMCGLLTAVAAAGCAGGSSPSSARPSPTAPSPSAIASQLSMAAAVDDEQADGINLQSTDFPAGWQPQANPVTSPDNINGEKTLYACLRARPPESHTTADENSPTFVLGEQQASSNVKFARTAAQSLTDYRVLASPAFPNCARRVLLDSLQRTLPPGSSVKSSSVGAVPAAAPSGEQVAETEATVDVEVQGNPMTIYADLVSVLRGRALVAVQAIGLGQPFPNSLQQGIISNVENRADQAPA